MGLQEKAVKNMNAYIEKAADKFGSMPIRKQCQTYLQLITVNKVSGLNIHQSFLKGMKEDYEKDNATSSITPEDWLKPYLAEPLFYKVMSKCKTTLAELEETLKGVK